MNILGMGTLEILVIMLVAFIVIGPSQMIVAARLLGKATREMKRITEDFPSLLLDEEQSQTIVDQESKGATVIDIKDSSSSIEGGRLPGNEIVAEEEQGPVDFHPSGPQNSPDTRDGLR